MRHGRAGWLERILCACSSAPPCLVALLAHCEARGTCAACAILKPLRLQKEYTCFNRNWTCIYGRARIVSQHASEHPRDSGAHCKSGAWQDALGLGESMGWACPRVLSPQRLYHGRAGEPS